MHFWKIGAALNLQPSSNRTAALLKLVGGKPVKLNPKLAQAAREIGRGIERKRLRYRITRSDDGRYRMRKVFAN